MNKQIQNWFLHIDLDAFFASVEQLDNPQYRGLPVIVGGRKDDKRGVVSTASYEARKFGVHSAMPIFQAVRLCPKGIFLRARIKRYAELSYEIMTIFKDFSPDVDQMSIDEAFVDLTGTEQLFGPPEETALKIKRRVKEETGLTVSIGLATTKYLAKIASGYSKPDGFYFIKPGEEQNFMLSLPLKKVWGIGPKALERLKKAGLYTTRDIYEKSFDILEFLFGKTMGLFLYNVVRGNEKEVFSRKPKSHSISAETTFTEDITDIYTAETELLELAHGVMFRLLKEEKFSRTITVKIKYYDFTSVTIQRTLDNNIITLDTFYENIKSLFEEKYEKGKGIRLLGVGFDKVENNDRPFQQSLFNDKEEKKHAVEKAILELNKKHPEIKIQKARLLKAIAVLFIIIYQFSPFQCNKILYAEDFSNKLVQSEVTNKKEDENTGSIFQWNINDKNKVDFSISGHWQIDMLGSFISTFNKNSPAFLDTPIPIFKQDIELSSLFTLNNKWYFEAGFADNFSNNILTIGYNGDKYFRSGKLSNRNITMPNNYSAEKLGFGLSGGNNQAPGFSAHWQSPIDKWSGDLLLRYDMTLPKTAVFYGKNKVNDTIISPDSYLYGYSFTFPEQSKNKLKEIKNIYVESENGTIKHPDGRLFKKLSASDYYYSEINNILYLSSSSGGKRQNNKTPAIFITFLSPLSVDSIISDTGTYKNESTYAGKIQLLFNKSDNKYNLEDFSYPLKDEIEYDKALVIQNNEGFSPYIVANTYDCGTNKNVEISVIYANSKNINRDYIAEIENNYFTSPYEDFFDKKHIYAKINNKNIQSNFPFVETNPEIYLNIYSEPEIVLQARSYNPVTKINIGQKASAGTINVLKNGTYISDFIYNINTGDIILSTPINNNDQIKITWQDEASDFAKGSLSLGIGFQLNILPNLKWDIAMTAQKPITFSDSISTPDNIKSSFIALSTGIDFSKNDFSISDKAAFSIKKQNDSDKLLISAQNDLSPKKYQHDINSGYETKADLFVNGKTLYQKDNFTIKSHKGEKDKSIEEGYKIPLQWDFSETHNSKNPWAAVDLKLEGGKELKKSSLLEIAICCPEYIQDGEKEYNIYLQLGITAGSDIAIKNTNIPTFNITEKIDFNNKDWQTITIMLSDKDRAFLSSNNDARIIVEKKENQNSKNQNLKSKLYIGPYTPFVQSIFTKADENILINTRSVPSENNSFSSEIKWLIYNEIPHNKSVITAKSYFAPSDFNPYKTINFKFAYEERKSEYITEEKIVPELSFILDTDNSYKTDKRNIAIKLDIYNISDYIDNIKKYHTVSIKTENNSENAEYLVYIDNKLLEHSDYNLHINKDVIPSCAKYEINTIIGNKIIKDGSFYVDNITFEDSDYIYSFENNLNGSYNKSNILTINNYPVISNLFIKGSSSQKIADKNINVLSSLNTGITISILSLQADILLKQIELQNAGHNIKTTKPILNLLSFDESYRWNNSEYLVEKSNNINFSLSSLKIPLYINTYISAKENNIQKEQNHNTVINSNFSIKNNDFTLVSSFSTDQKINMIKNNNFPSINENYFYNWFDITKFQFSTGEPTATTRNSTLSNRISVNINNDFIKPSILYDLTSSFENIKTPLLTDKISLNISLPITLKNHFISFNLSKNGGDTVENTQETKKSYFSDLDYLFKIQPERYWFYTSIPFYELFDQNMNSKVKGNYSAKYEINYSKKLSNSFKDLYIPSYASFAVIRDIKSKEKFSDTYQLKTTVTNKSINNFGKNSDKKIFKWFNQEEITSSITGIVKIPIDNPKNTTYNISSYIQILLMIKDSSFINSFFDFSFETNMDWHTKGTIFYSRPGKTCLMSAIASFFSDKVDKIDFDILRKDSFTFSIGTTDKINRQQYDYSHNVEMSFLDHFTLSNGLGFTVTYIENGSSQLSINYSLGGKISF